MLKYCLDKWNQNKDMLKAELETNSELNTCSYTDLVKLVVDYVLNPGEGEKWDSDNITEVDNGDYQGTLLFLIPATTYQPFEFEYLMTYVRYGSCSGCDTLQAIKGWEDGPLTASQVNDFMKLCKDLVTNMVKPYNGGWRFTDGFEEVTM